MNINIHSLGRYMRTVAYLRPVQIYYRIVRKLLVPKLYSDHLPHLAHSLNEYILPIKKKKSFSEQGIFNLLNFERNLFECGWDDRSVSLLWRFNQHYHDDLTAESSPTVHKRHYLLTDHWIENNVVTSTPSWHPYPTSLRIVNWIKWCIRTNVCSEKVRLSLALQARWLSKNIEWHILGNHVFANAKALVYAGLFFDGIEAEEWLATGMKILETEFDEQILPDGGHFELSPMYHAIILEDVLDLINICRASLSRLSEVHKAQLLNWETHIPLMLTWLNTMSHPDRRLSFFNDAAFGIAAENSELLDYAFRLKLDLGSKRTDELFTFSGYARIETSTSVLIADLAEVGATYIPGHAHADTLSFEFSYLGKRIFVNSGISEYSNTRERLKQRSTLAHNTVCINEQNSTEVWSSFRVGRRAKVTQKSLQYLKNNIILTGTHDGYCKDYGVLHKRTFELQNAQLVITDDLSKDIKAQARFHLHPKVAIEQKSPFSGILHLENNCPMYWKVEGVDSVSIEETEWHPEFGLSLKNHCLNIAFSKATCKFILQMDE